MPASRTPTPSRPSAAGASRATSSTSRATATRSTYDATARWLHQIGLPYDELYCAHDKVGHCVALGVDLLIDDSPENLSRAIDQGIAVATISHPWNRDVCENEDVICGKDWTELASKLDPILRRTRLAS